jgi:hypothetical protein
MDKENVAYVQNGILLGHQEERNYVTFRKTGGTGDHYI